MKTSLKHLPLYFLAAFTLLIFSAFSSVKSPDEPYLVKEFTQHEPGNLEVTTSGGSINVSAHEGNTVRVEMWVQVGGKKIAAGDAEGEKILKDFNINISQEGNTVSAVAEKKENTKFQGKNHPNISFTVLVPKRTTSNLTTSGGSISLDGVEGSQEVKTSGGSLSFKNINGNVEGHTSGGSIEVLNYTGVLNGNTSGGSINLRDSKGELKVHTSGGSINIENVQGNIDASTSGGTINAKLLTLDKQVKLHTSGGSIKAVLPSGVGLDLDLQGEKVNTRLQDFNGQADKGRVKGSMNGGGIEVVMSTSGGNIDLEYQ
jgi:hypothetical protein